MRTRTMLSVFAVAIALLLVSTMAQSPTTVIQTCQPLGTANVLAPWYCSQINQQVAGIWERWAPIGFIAISLSFLIAAVILMIGIAMRNDKMRDFAIGELYEASATTIIVVMFLVLCATLFGIIPSFFTGPLDPYNTSLSFISSTINTTQGVITSLYNVVMIQAFYSSVVLKVQIGPAGSESRTLSKAVSEAVNPLAAFITSFFIIPAQTISSLLVDGLLALNAEFYLILFFMYVAIPVFLIPGIIFRAIFPLRSVGGMLIGVAVSFYLIMPILFSISFLFTNTSVISQLTAASLTITANGQGTSAETNAGSPTSPLVTEVNGLETTVGSYFLATLFYPALILALTYFAMQTIADFIGGAAKTSSKLGLL